MRLISIILSILLCSSVALSHILDGAKWIGVQNCDLPFYPDYLSVFSLEFDFKTPDQSSISLKYGQNDPRLLNKNMNIYQLENKIDESYIKVEIDNSGNLNIHRTGYHPEDKPSIPIASFKLNDLKDSFNHLKISSNLGITEFFLNNKSLGKAFLNPIGKGGDYTAFPVLAQISTDIPANSTGEISNIVIRNFRDPQNILFHLPGTVRQSGIIPLPTRSMPELISGIEIPESKKINKAVIYSSARGIYDLLINGNLINKEYFNPGSTQYNKTHLYQEFDITGQLHPGKNDFLVRLGEGWWSGPHTFTGENWNFFGDRQSFIAKILISYSDGTTSEYHTDTANWKYRSSGPVIAGSFFNGEVYDASKESLDSSDWKPVMEINLDSTVNRSIGAWDKLNLRPSFGDRVMPVDTIVSISLIEPSPGLFVYDMGQNMAGIPCIRFHNLHPGQEVSLRFAEMLYPDMPQYSGKEGTMMTENLRAALVKDIYRAGAHSETLFSPRFTLHGFRYIEISGIEKPLELKDVMAIPLSSIHKINAHFECSDSLVNILWKNIIRSTQSNFISIPTDCPQRNERLGWMGDISVFAPTATKIADISPLLRQYLTSVRDCQQENGRFPDVAPTGFGFGGLLWGSAGITVPWEYYRQYGDKDLFREHYPSMKRYIDYIFAETMEPETGIIIQNRAWGDLGDWLSPEYDKSDKSLLWECYLIYDLEIMGKIAKIIGETQDARIYDTLREERIKFFIDTYIDPESQKTIYSGFDPQRKGSLVDTQVSYALPIAMGIYSDPLFVENFLRTLSRENTADDGSVLPPFSLMTGFIGTAWISEALSRTDNPDFAYRLLTSKEYPSWLYPVTQGATSIWERLNSYTHKDGFGKNNSMNSFNHYSFGSVGNWLITRSLGINVDIENGIITISPQPDLTQSISDAKGWLDTKVGRISSAWKIKDDTIAFEIVVPDSVNSIFKFRNKIVQLSPGLNVIKLER